ncbi:hypothetical protein AAKU67_002044 [Oxalobacteraceae bacterium GrIS 2.11]
MKLTVVSLPFFSGILLAAYFFLPKKKYLFFYVFSVAMILCVRWPQISESYQLKENGVHATAVIRSVDCENHGHIFYDYQVGARTFQKEADSLDAGLKCGPQNVGSTVPISYVSSDPDISIIGFPGSNFSYAIVMTVLMMIGIPVLIILFSVFKKEEV